MRLCNGGGCNDIHNATEVASNEYAGLAHVIGRLPLRMTWAGLPLVYWGTKR